MTHPTAPSVMYQPIQTLGDRHLADLIALYQQTWWADTRQAADVRRMLTFSDFHFGWVEVETDQLVAFCRVISDRVYRAIVLDVIVSKAHRGQRLGLGLIEQVVQHPELRQVECIQLFCKPEMVPFYQRFGFEILGPLDLMTRIRPDLVDQGYAN